MKTRSLLTRPEIGVSIRAEGDAPNRESGLFSLAGSAAALEGLSREAAAAGEVLPPTAEVRFPPMPGLPPPPRPTGRERPPVFRGLLPPPL